MTSKTALAAALIQVFEGCRLTAYQDSGGVWTIGFGHTAGVKQGDTITYEQAVEFFNADAMPLLAAVSRQKPLAGAAYVSFGYNCGRTAMEQALDPSTPTRLLNYVHDRHGNVLPGLVARRNLESLLIQYDTGTT